MFTLFNKHQQTIATSFGLFILRSFLAWEFFDSGLAKWNGQNWFADIQTQFPFPISILPADINWYLAMSAELILPFFLLFGLLTRFASLGLAFVIGVAWYAIHGANGYNICDNGYKLVFIYSIMLLLLILQGAGIFSLDFLLQKKQQSKKLHSL